MNQRKFSLGGLIIGLSLLLAACGAPSPKLALLSDQASILAFGDSLTYGTGVTTIDSYPNQLALLTGRKFINKGVPGEISAQGLARLPDVLDQVLPDLLILIHGGNDLLRNLPETALKQNLRQMITLAQARYIPVVMMSLPRRSVFLKPAALYAELAEEMNIPLDTNTLTDILKQPSLKSDQVHPNAAGYLMMAQSLQRLLKASGAL